MAVKFEFSHWSNRGLKNMHRAFTKTGKPPPTFFPDLEEEMALRLLQGNFEEPLYQRKEDTNPFAHYVDWRTIRKSMFNKFMGINDGS